MQTRFIVKKKKTQGQKSLRYDLAVYKTSEILKVTRALMRPSQKADQRATPHRSALDFRFSFFVFGWRVLASAERSDADLYHIKTSTGLGAKTTI